MSQKNTGRVQAWQDEVIILTYPVPEPERNPMFLDKRMYQGSRGSVYPSPFTDRICDTKLDKAYQVVILENEYVRLMILPEIGGRIHVGQDKTNGYDFFYRRNAIKPVLGKSCGSCERLQSIYLLPGAGIAKTQAGERGAETAFGSACLRRAAVEGRDQG